MGTRLYVYDPPGWLAVCRRYQHAKQCMKTEGVDLAHGIQEAAIGNGVISSLLQAVVHHLQGGQQLIVHKVGSRVILQHLLHICAAATPELRHAVKTARCL